MKAPNKNVTFKICRQDEKQSALSKSSSESVWPNFSSKKKKALQNPSKPLRDHKNVDQSKSMNLNANKFFILQVDELQETDDAPSGECIPCKPSRRVKAKGKRLLNVKQKMAEKNFSAAVLPKDNPIVFRCRGCFQSHFPNAKFCARNREVNREEKNEFLLIFLNKKTRGVRKLRGGADSSKNCIPIMIKEAIESAKKHGISLSPGVRNKADGNCAFESVVYNINYRPCFSEKLPLHPDEYRKIWITNLENAAKKNPSLIPGFSDDEMRKNWAELKRSGTYNIPFF